ncbi:MAG: GTP 3',8-cyclase MoaA [Nitrospinae bacterium]|nr:GTP 3',8-cyclase MoaA [Nitrospinota bacterium]
MDQPKDRFGRGVNYIRVSVTKRCNLRCAYCMPMDGSLVHPNNDILTIGQITRLVALFAPFGIRKVRLTGGEPLLRKGIFGLIRDLKNISGIDEVTMTTNGVLLEKMIPRLQEAGLDRINISLDSLKPERLRGISGHDIHGAVVRAIRHVTDGRLWPLKINVVAIRGFNDDEILDFAQLAHELPVEIRFIEMMPTAHNRLFRGRSAIPAAEIERAVRERLDLRPARHTPTGGPAEVYDIVGGAGRVGFVAPLSRHFCGGCNRLRLTAEGALRSCLFSDSEVDLRRGFLGDAPDQWFIDRFRESLAAKPEGHGLTAASDAPCEKPMAAIGG